MTQITLPKSVTDIMRSDFDRIRLWKEHRKLAEQAWFYAKSAWMLQNMPHNRTDVANVAIGLSRMISESMIAGINAARPAFEPKPYGSKAKGRIKLWKDGISYILDQSNFDLSQTQFLTDFTVLGLGAYDVTPQIPTYIERIEKSDWEFEEKIRFDLSQPRLRIRARVPWQVWVDPSSDYLETARNTYDEELIPFIDFTTQYAAAKNVDGSQKFRHTDLVKPGLTLSFGDDDSLLYRENENRMDKVLIGRLQMESANILRIYANGVLICQKPLRAVIRDGKMVQQGLNVLGTHSLCFGGNNHTYDRHSNTHALYPMGEPEKVKQLEKIYNLFSGMTVDNWKLSNSFVLYGPGMEDIDLNNTSFYSGAKASGEVGVAPLGQVDLSKYQYVVEQIDNWCTILTGSNFRQVIGDPSKTLGEQILRKEAQTKTWEKKVKHLEDTAYRKLGSLTLAGLLTEYSSEDWEEMSEDESADAKSRIKKGKAYAGDYQFSDDLKSGKKRVYYSLPVKNSQASEDFSRSDTRGPQTAKGILEYADQDALFPIVSDYLWDEGFSMEGRLPDVLVSGLRSVEGSRAIRNAQLSNLGNYVRLRLQDQASGLKGGETSLSLKKLDPDYVSSLGMDPEELMETPESEEEPDIAAIDKQIDSVIGQSEALYGQIPALPTAQGAQPQAQQSGGILADQLA